MFVILFFAFFLIVNNRGYCESEYEASQEEDGGSVLEEISLDEDYTEEDYTEEEPSDNIEEPEDLSEGTEVIELPSPSKELLEKVKSKEKFSKEDVDAAIANMTAGFSEIPDDSE